MASKEQFEQIASRCSQFKNAYDGYFKSGMESSLEQEPNCEKCIHFTHDHKCELNLIDEILSNMDVKLDD